jgi:serine protease AprX
MAVNRMFGTLLLVVLTMPVFGQMNRYMVFFRDKNGTPYTISNAEAFLSEKALNRREKHHVAVSELDLPVNPDYLDQVRAAGAEVYFPTRWMNGVLVQCDPAVATSIAAIASVDHVEMVGPGARLTLSGRRKTIERKKTTASTQVTDTQLKMLGIDTMHEEGMMGNGITIGVFDAGFEGVNTAAPFQHLFDKGHVQLDLSRDFVYNSPDVFQYDDHGTEVLSVIAGFSPGAFTGGAYEATFQLYVTEEVPTEYRVEEFNWLFAAERADSAGVDIIQSSLGYYDFDVQSMDYLKSQMDGKTTVISRAAQWAADRGIVIVTSAGNEGNNSWQIITAPADVVDVLAVANVDADLNRATSSSVGPSADLRIKPDVAALGTGTRVIEKSGQIGQASGTSLSAPLVTSLAAGVLQRFPDLTNRQLLTAIRISATQAARPDYFIGYGVPNYRTVYSYLLQEEDFAVYPNPFESSSQQIIIRPKGTVTVTDCSLELVSSEGKSLYRNDAFFSKQQELYSPDMSDKAVGMYMVRIGCPTKNYVYKVVKK